MLMQFCYLFTDSSQKLDVEKMLEVVSPEIKNRTTRLIQTTSYLHTMLSKVC